MTGNPQVVQALNHLLGLELSAIYQYSVHALAYANWGYAKLNEYTFKRAKAEMEHAEHLIERILFLGGTPKMDAPLNLKIGSKADAMLGFDRQSEVDTIRDYNTAIDLCLEVSDAATRKVLQEIVGEEDQHLFNLEERLTQIAQMGLDNFLSTQA